MYFIVTGKIGVTYKSFINPVCHYLMYFAPNYEQIHENYIRIQYYHTAVLLNDL